MSDRPDHPAADTHPALTDPARPLSPPGTTEPAGASVGEPVAATAPDEPASKEPAATGPFGEPPPTAAPAHGQKYRGLALGLAATLLLVLALVGTAPLWAPLLPWGDERSGLDPAIVKRLDADQQQVRLLQQQVAAATAAMPKLEQRVGALEQKPPTPPPELADMRQRLATVSAGVSDLASRLERLANTVQTQAAGVSDLKTRLERAEQAQQAQTAEVAAKLGPLTQSLQAQQSAQAALGSRLEAFEKATRSRAGDLTDMGLTLALLQIRNAVETGQPFPAQYDALSSLAKTRPEIAAAAAPLAAAAATGTADRAALAQELHALEQKIGAAPAVVGSNGGWTGAVLDRLRGLVRIRRAEEAEPGKEAEAAVTVAERALAGGDLARAVAAIETLQGPAAADSRGLAAQGTRAACRRGGAAAARRAADGAARRHGRDTGLARLMRILLALILLAAAVAAGVYFADNPGQVEIAWQGWLIDTSVGVLVALAALFAFLASVLALLVTGLRRTPAAVRRRRAEGRRRAGEAELTRGLVALAAADASAARRHAERARILLGETPVVLLLAAEAASRQGDPDAARRAYAALLDRRDTEFLGLRGLIGQALRAGDDAAALPLAERARALRPDAPWLADNLLRLQARAGNWRAARETLAMAARRRRIAGQRRTSRARRRAVRAEPVGRARGRSPPRLEAGGAKRSFWRPTLRRSPATTPACCSRAGAGAPRHGRSSGPGKPRRTRNSPSSTWRRAAPPSRWPARPRCSGSPRATPMRRKATSRSAKRRSRRGCGARRAAT